MGQQFPLQMWPHKSSTTTRFFKSWPREFGPSRPTFSGSKTWPEPFFGDQFWSRREKKLEWDRSSFADINIINKPVQLTAATFQLTHQHSSCCWVVFSLQSIKTCKKHTTLWGSYPKNDVKNTPWTQHPIFFGPIYTASPLSPSTRTSFGSTPPVPLETCPWRLWRSCLALDDQEKNGERTENRSQPFWNLGKWFFKKSGSNLSWSVLEIYETCWTFSIYKTPAIGRSWFRNPARKPPGLGCKTL